MPAARITEAEVDHLLKSGCLVATGVHRLQPKSDRTWLGASIPIQSTHKKFTHLTLTVSIGSSAGKTSFCLLWENIRIRGLCIDGNHGNNHTDKEVWHRRTHIHVYSDVCVVRYARNPPGEVPADFHDQFDYFLRLCGIMGDAAIAPIPAAAPVQKEFFDDEV